MSFQVPLHPHKFVNHGSSCDHDIDDGYSCLVPNPQWHQVLEPSRRVLLRVLGAWLKASQR